MSIATVLKLRTRRSGKRKSFAWLFSHPLRKHCARLCLPGALRTETDFSLNALNAVGMEPTRLASIVCAAHPGPIR